MAISWKYFSLEQVNNKQGPHWKIWEQSEDCPSQGLRAFHAAEAAKRQGETAFDSFHIALLRAKHEQNRDITNTDTLIEVAEGANLNITQFKDNINDKHLLAKLAEDHSLAVENHKVFGTPTLVFPEGQAIFLKMSPPPPGECLAVFCELCHLAQRQGYIQEIKRPK